MTATGGVSTPISSGGNPRGTGTALVQPHDGRLCALSRGIACCNNTATPSRNYGISRLFVTVTNA